LLLYFALKCNIDRFKESTSHKRLFSPLQTPFDGLQGNQGTMTTRPVFSQYVLDVFNSLLISIGTPYLNSEKSSKSVISLTPLPPCKYTKTGYSSIFSSYPSGK